MKLETSIYNTLEELINSYKQNKDLLDCEITIETIIDSFVDCFRRKLLFEKDILKKHTLAFLVSWLYISYNAHFAFAIKQGDEYDHIPINLLGNNINPNIIIQNMHIHLTNLAISVIHLCVKGQDYAARIVLRSLFELCCLISTILFDDEKMKLYCETGDETEESNAIWYKNFRPKILMKNLEKIETIILNEELKQMMINKREGFYSYYSGISHSLYLDCMVAAYVDTGKGLLETSLFGNINTGIASTVNAMNDMLFYFSLLNTHIIFHHRSFKITQKSGIWSDTIVLGECARDMHMYEKEKRSRNNS